MAVPTFVSLSSPLTLCLFGPMQVLVHGHPLPRLRSRKSLWLLALLALRHGRPIEREWLAGTLWPDMERSRGLTNLRVVLSELRRVLGDQSERLQSPGRHTLSLNLAGAEVDLVVFDTAMVSKKQAALEQAVTVYRGPLLEDCAEEWSAQERRGREQECLAALQMLADTALAAGDPTTAIGYYRRAVNLDPWLEAAQRGWMEALARSGDRNAAMQVYREFRELLRSDPSAVPDDETSALYERLRADARRSPRTQAAVPAKKVADASPSRVVKGYLPHPLTDLVGREEECREVAAKLQGARLVTLTGPGGIGKTRLAIEVAAEIVLDSDASLDSVWLVSLEALAEGRLVGAQIAALLGVREEAGRSLLERVIDHLRTKRILLVLDNCEHLLEASAQVVSRLLQECAWVRILATSREALGIAGEMVWQVPALATPDPSHLPSGPATLLRVLMGYESVQLFVERAQSCQKGFALTGSNAMAVARICFQLDGIPLALELAAARVRALTVDEIAAHLYGDAGLLTRGNRAALSRQQTLRATLDWSYALLTGAERNLLRRLSIFVGGWTLEAAEHVGCGEGVAERHVLDLLSLLVEKSLVVFEGLQEDTQGRYRLLEMVRQYAVEKLTVESEEAQVRRRHRDWFLLLAEEAAPHLRGGNQRHWLRRLDREYGNLRAALAWSESDGQEAELRLVSALWRFWYVRGDYSEGRQYLRKALNREVAQARTVTRAQALNGAGALAYDQGDFRVARMFLEESLRIGREREDRASIAAALGTLANVDLAVGEIGSARTLYEESLALYRELDNPVGIALLLSNVGIVLRQQGDYAAARECFEESLRLSQALNDRIGMARVLLNRGNVAFNQDDPVLERVCIEESLSLFRELGDKQGIARSLGNLGSSLGRAEEWEAAQAAQEESLHIFQELGDRRGVAQAFSLLGDIACHRADYVAAGTLYREGLRLFENRPGIAESLEGLAMALLMRAETRRAVQLWGAAEALRRNLGFPLPDNSRRLHDQNTAQARSTLGEAAFAIAWSEGAALVETGRRLRLNDGIDKRNVVFRFRRSAHPRSASL